MSHLRYVITGLETTLHFISLLTSVLFSLSLWNGNEPYNPHYQGMSCLGYHVELVVRDFNEIVNKYEIFANEYDDVTAVKQPIKLQCLAAFTAVKLRNCQNPLRINRLEWVSRDGTNQYSRLYEFYSNLSAFVFDKLFVAFLFVEQVST